MEIVTTKNGADRIAGIYDSLYAAKYPNGLNLSPGTTDHGKLLVRLTDRISAGFKPVSERLKSWRYIDEVLNVFVSMDETEAKIKAKDDRTPVVVIVPETFSTLDTLLTYDIAAFVKEPFFEYSPVGPEDVIPAILANFYMDHNIESFDLFLKFHTWWRDAKTYGVGVVGGFWSSEEVEYPVRKSGGSLFDYLSRLYNPNKKQNRIIKEGCDIVNFDPYNLLLDSSTPIEKAAFSNFFGWVEPLDRMSVLEIAASDGDMFNLKYLGHYQSCTTKHKGSSSTGRTSAIDNTAQSEITELDPVDLVHLYVKLIPSDWGLSESNDVERWYFILAGEDVILKATYMSKANVPFPIAVIAPNYDGRSTLPLSILEINSGMQGYLDWSLRTKIAAVRKSLINTVLVDPYAVNLLDFDKPGPVRYIRTTRSAKGRPVSALVQQLQFIDKTNTHVADIMAMRALMGESAATVDLTRGVQNRRGDRVTGAEVNLRLRGAMSRLSKNALIVALMGHKPLARLFLRMTIENATNDVFVKVTSGIAKQLADEYGLSNRMNGNFMKISPSELNYITDIKTSVGDISWMQDTEVSMRMLELILNNPLFTQTFDAVRLFKHIGRTAGIKNIDAFVLQNRIPLEQQEMPDEEVRSKLAAGKIKPINKEAMQ